MKFRSAHTITGLTTILGSASLMFYMMRLAPRWLQVKRLRVGITGLPAEWRGVRIAHLSDFHVGEPNVPVDMLWRARREAEAFDPDIIALTGDFYHDGNASESGILFAEWPSCHVLAVLGNHDHRGGVEHVATLVRDLCAAGVIVLNNTAVDVSLRGRAAWLAGVNDPYTGRDDIDSALSAVPMSEDALLLLAHAPTVLDSMPVGRARLALCGHTHGGQVRLLPSGRTPFLRVIHWLIGEPKRHEPSIYHGMHWVRGAVVCISNGLGMSQLPIRFRTRPQVVLIELEQPVESDRACDNPKRFFEDLTREPRWARWFS
jgi:uncharacterized protein